MKIAQKLMKTKFIINIPEVFSKQRINFHFVNIHFQTIKSNWRPNLFRLFIFIFNGQVPVFFHKNITVNQYKNWGKNRGILKKCTLCSRIPLSFCQFMRFYGLFAHWWVIFFKNMLINNCYFYSSQLQSIFI